MSSRRRLLEEQERNSIEQLGKRVRVSPPIALRRSHEQVFMIESWAIVQIRFRFWYGLSLGLLWGPQYAVSDKV